MKMSSTQEIIRRRLEKDEPEQRRLYSIPLSVDLMERMKRIAKAVSRHTGKSYSRNQMIQDALDSFLMDCEGYRDKEGNYVFSADKT